MSYPDEKKNALAKRHTRLVQAQFPGYRQPGGLPHYWMAETSGVLAAAVKAYLEGTPTERELELVIDYLHYVIYAPCWNDSPTRALNSLRLEMAEATITTVAELNRWLDRCLVIGIDAL